MAPNGYPDDPNNYSESDPTQYANFGGTSGEAYSEYTPPPTGYPPYTGPTPEVVHTGQYPAPVPPPTPWHQRPVVLVGLGVLTAALLALLVFAVVRYTNSGTSERPTETSTTTSAPTSSSTTESSSSAAPAPTTQTAAPAPSTTAAPPPPPPPPPTTVTTTVTPTTTVAPTTTTQAPSTTTSVTTSVTTVTETTTKPLFPNWPRPTPRPAPTLMEPPAGG